MLDDLDPKTRGAPARGAARLRRRDGGRLARSTTACATSSPRIDRSTALLDEVTHDRVALNRLVAAGSRVAQTFADHSAELGDTASDAADTLDALASEQRALAGILTKAPPVMRQATGTLGRLADTLHDVEPVVQGGGRPRARSPTRCTEIAATPPSAERTVRAPA